MQVLLGLNPPLQSFSTVTSLGCKEKCMVILQMTLLFMCSLHASPEWDSYFQ